MDCRKALTLLSELEAGPLTRPREVLEVDEPFPNYSEGDLWVHGSLRRSRRGWTVEPIESKVVKATGKVLGMAMK